MSDNLLMMIDNKVNSELADIKNSNLLENLDMEKLQKLVPELKHNIQTQTIWRTETEIIVSVLNDKDFPDKASKYHQAKLEQMVFFDQLSYLSFEYRKVQKQIDIIQCDIEELYDKLDRTKDQPLYITKRIKANIEIKEIEKQQLVYRLQNMKMEAKDRLRELEIWSKIKEELDDGSFDKDNKDSNQLLSLTKRYIMEAWNLALNPSSVSDTAGYNNIISQFNTMVNECISRGLINEILEYFGNDSDISKWLIASFKIRI